MASSFPLCAAEESAAGEPPKDARGHAANAAAENVPTTYARNDDCVTLYHVCINMGFGILFILCFIAVNSSVENAAKERVNALLFAERAAYVAGNESASGDFLARHAATCILGGVCVRVWFKPEEVSCTKISESLRDLVTR